RFVLASITVVATLIIAIFLLFFQYRLLTVELRARERAEQEARTAYEREAALRQDRERFHIFVDAVKDYAIYVLDPAGNIVTWNQGAERIKGYPAEEIIGTNFSRFFTEEDRRSGKPEQELESAAREQRFQGEAWRVRKDGSRFWASVVLTA